MSNSIITHLAKHYTARELAEALVCMDSQPDVYFWTHLDIVRARRLPARIRGIESRVRSLERICSRLSLFSPRYERAVKRLSNLQITLGMLKHELAKNKGKEAAA